MVTVAAVTIEYERKEDLLMSYFENNILASAYQHYKQTTSLTYHVCLGATIEDRQKTLNILSHFETEGYIEIISLAIGEAYIKLTNYGLSYCEQNF